MSQSASSDWDLLKSINQSKSLQNSRSMVFTCRPTKDRSGPVRGTMDAFAEKDPNRKRKRRKKLVEKTTMVNGYLRTETEAIWEDVFVSI